MEIGLLTEIASSQFVWAICTLIMAFFGFKYFVRSKDKSDSLILDMYKEDRLNFDCERKEYLKQLDKFNDSLERQYRTQKEIVNTIKKMDERFDSRLSKIEGALK